jgi:co-chaperonin GroES (HSP10)
MQIAKVKGDRVFLKNVSSFKEKDSQVITLEQFEEVKLAEVAYTGEACSFTKQGDKVIIPNNTGLQLPFDGTTYTIVREKDIMFHVE